MQVMPRADHSDDPQAATWEELTEAFEFTPTEREEIARGAAQMIAACRAHRCLAEHAEALAIRRAPG
jgi:hypothetical protein